MLLTIHFAGRSPPEVRYGRLGLQSNGLQAEKQPLLCHHPLVIHFRQDLTCFSITVLVHSTHSQQYATLIIDLQQLSHAMQNNVRVLPLRCPTVTTHAPLTIVERQSR